MEKDNCIFFFVAMDDNCKSEVKKTKMETMRQGKIENN
jgi:hypothetical protein